MNIGGMKTCVKAITGCFAKMRVATLKYRNIRNNMYIYKKIYKKQVDNQQPLRVIGRNMSEHTGTFFIKGFRHCSGKTPHRNTPTAFTNQGLQKNRPNKRSGMFRLWMHIAQRVESHVIRGFQRFNFFCSGCSGEHVCARAF